MINHLLPLPQMSDRGGGVPLRKIERLFSYLYSTAPRPSFTDKHRAPLVRKAARVRLQTKVKTKNA